MLPWLQEPTSIKWKSTFEWHGSNNNEWSGRETNCTECTDKQSYIESPPSGCNNDESEGRMKRRTKGYGGIGVYRWESLVSDMTKGSVYRLGRGKKAEKSRTKVRGTRERDRACDWKAKHAAMHRDVRGRSFRGQGKRRRGVIWTALRRQPGI